MKKILIMIFLAVVVQNINAQLVIDTYGRVGIGNNVTPNYLLTVNSYNEALERRYLGYFNCAHEGLYIQNNGSPYESSSYQRGINLENSSTDAEYLYGLISQSSGTSYNSLVCSVMGKADDAGTANIGVLGIKSGPSNKGAGIYGVGGNPTYTFPSNSATYAGFFYGNVHVTGSLTGALLTSTLNSPSVSGDRTLDGETTETRVITDETSERISDKLQQVQLLQFIREKQPSEEDAIKIESEENKDAGKENGDTVVQTKLSTIQYGLAADQLKAVYPELVYEDENGNVSINYVEMVPLLVQSINELSQELAELKGKTSKKVKAKAESEVTTIDETVSEVDMVRMDQNKPNPFSESTVIKLSIPEKTQKANIFIYDMSGKQVKSIPVDERGETDITVYASDLSAGMYIYTLVVDGKVEVTRKMIVSEV